MTYTPAVGDRVTITRTRPDGRTHFIKTGVITSVSQFGYDFVEDHARRRFVADSGSVAEKMRGWSQTIEPG